MTAKNIALDPVTGAPLKHDQLKPCCHSRPAAAVALGSSADPSSVNVGSSSSSSSLLYSLLGVAVVAGVSYAGYRAYEFYRLEQSRLASAGLAMAESSAIPAFHTVIVPAENQFDAIVAQSSRVFILVEAAKLSGSTGPSWCPDCNRAEPLIISALNDYAQSVTLIRAPVGRDSYKNNPSHPYRIHPELRVQRIPTLYAVDSNGRVLRQLIETQCHDADGVKRFVAPQ